MALGQRGRGTWKWKWVVALAAGFCLPLSALAGPLVNVTVDRTSSSIDYEPQADGGWAEAWPGVRIAADPRATATLSFEGVAIYYEGWLWSQPTMFLADVDNLTVTIDITDHANLGDVNATAVPTTGVTTLIAGNLTESVHKLVLRRDDTQREVIVGSFIYSTGNPPSSSVVSSMSTAAPSASSASSSSGSKKINLEIILPSVLGGVLFVSMLSLLIILSLKLRTRRKVRDQPLSPPVPFPLGRQPTRRGKQLQDGSRGSLPEVTDGVREDDSSSDRNVIRAMPADFKEDIHWRIE